MLMTAGIIVSCSSDDAMLQQEEPAVEILKSCTMTFTGQIIPFDIDATRKNTRATSSKWADSTNLYIVFKTSSTPIIGTASFTTSRGWSISYTGALPASQAGKCEVYYFENSTSSNYSTIQIGNESIVYADKEGFYEYNSSTNTCVVNATLSPIVSRIRFKGTNGTKITLGGISRFTDYGISDGSLNTSDSDVELVVNSRGYTPYVYGFFGENSNREMSVTNGDYIYTTQCGTDIFALGESGYMNVPTEASHSGWTVKQAMQTSGAVDLGLSVKWAACNIGASSPEEYGNYYAWGETETKADYSSATYKHKANSYTYKDIGENIAGTEYDAAHVKLGGTWMMPTVEQIQELIEKCKIEQTSYKNTIGQKITGPNGKSIFIPISGYYQGRSIESRGEYGYVQFWGSQYYSQLNSWAYYYRGYDSRAESDHSDKAYGMPIRPITK